MSQNINSLFQSAADEGDISQASLHVLTVTVPDSGAQIQAAMGMNVNDVKAGSVVLVNLMPDDSGSIRFAGNAQLMRDGHNLVIDALRGTKQRNNILLLTRYLNGYILNPYTDIDDAKYMDTHNYDPNMGTPLYDQSVVFFGSVLAKAKEFCDNGIPVTTISLIMSDGADQHSVSARAHHVSLIVDDMLKQETHIIAAMGIEDRSGGSVNFREIFKEMGIRDEWILTPGNSQGEIRKAFNLFSQSAVQASQGAQSFSKTAMGGFGN